MLMIVYHRVSVNITENFGLDDSVSISIIYLFWDKLEYKMWLIIKQLLFFMEEVDQQFL